MKIKKNATVALLLALTISSSCSAKTAHIATSINSPLPKITSAMEVTATLALYHSPVIKLPLLKQQVLSAFLKTDNETGVNNRDVKNAQAISISSATNLNELLIKESQLEEDLIRISMYSAKDIDIKLSQHILTLKNDPYTRFEELIVSKKVEKEAPLVVTDMNSDMKISSFNSINCRLSNDSIIDGMTIDLRNNGGGTIQCSLEALSSFFPKGKHLVGKLYTNDKAYDLFVQGTRDKAITGHLKVNKQTASSAEFFMNVLKNRGWKTNGQKTFGKIATQHRFQSPYGKYFITFGHYSAL